ncbi:MAG: hypothetical protein HDQ96_09605 [Lachnospiraceae bacterium]|nr:hypothetical protein [Lachnospiraceae bacterium]
MMLKKRLLVLSCTAVCLFLVSCGKTGGDETEPKLVAPLSEIMDSVYENADLSQDFRESMAHFESGEIPAESSEYLIGTADIAYEESFFSIPMMNVQPYQCILLRLPKDADIEAAKQLIVDNADTRKWICVEAESVVVENVGNVVLFVMGDSQTTNALQTAFVELGENN